jgi:hypothetical protein
MLATASDTLERVVHVTEHGLTSLPRKVAAMLEPHAPSAAKLIRAVDVDAPLILGFVLDRGPWGACLPLHI